MVLLSNTDPDLQGNYLFQEDAWGPDFYEIDNEPKFSNVEGSGVCQVDRE